MLNLNRISPKTDFCSEIEALGIKLDIVNKNVLYVTHECDKILKLVKSLETSGHLQKQVDEYFDDEDIPQNIPEKDDLD